MNSSLGDYFMEEYEENLISSLFEISKEEARNVIKKVGTNINKVRKHIEKEKRNEIYQPCRCKICGRMLTNPESIVRGYGSECYNKIHSDTKNSCSFDVNEIEMLVQKDGGNVE